VSTNPGQSQLEPLRSKQTMHRAIPHNCAGDWSSLDPCNIGNELATLWQGSGGGPGFRAALLSDARGRAFFGRHRDIRTPETDEASGELWF
jgi:hypothetical protein